MKTFLLGILGLVLLYGCGRVKLLEKGAPKYISETKEWHNGRVARLKRDNGWLNLVGLYWLKQGENTFGSDKSNSLVFPEKAPKSIGAFYLKDSVVSVKINADEDVLIDSAAVKEMKLKNDNEANTSIMELGSLKWYVIKRGNKFGIRLRDLEAQLLKEFEGVDTFPVNEDWRIKAEFVEYNPPKNISIPTIIGTVEEDFSPGALRFTINEKQYSLDPTKAGSGYFLIFADLTSGEETYGAGRFLYVEEPDSLGNIYIDFNRAYNPPCAFTKYATCPLPPEQNRLKVRITAGEKNFGEHY
jgi:uncharacterized protein (DUF1684 family)